MKAIAMHQEIWASHETSMGLSLTFLASTIRCKAAMKWRSGPCSMRERGREKDKTFCLKTWRENSFGRPRRTGRNKNNSRKICGKKNFHGLSPRANYTDRATAACRRSDCQLFADRGVPRGQRDGSLRPYSRFSRQEPLLFLLSSSSVVLTRLSGPRSRPTTFFL
jgi:hypothetical protein